MSFEMPSLLKLLSHFLSSVCLHVKFQITTLTTSEITMVAFERFFSSVLPHVNLQMTTLTTSVITMVAFDRFFSSV